METSDIGGVLLVAFCLLLEGGVTDKEANNLSRERHMDQNGRYSSGNRHYNMSCLELLPIPTQH